MTHRLSLVLALVSILAGSILVPTASAAPAGDVASREGGTTGRSIMRKPVAMGTSEPLRSVRPSDVRSTDPVEIPRHMRPVRATARPDDEAATPSRPPRGGVPSSPPLLDSWEGIANADNPSLVLPPDPSGDVGDGFYVQVVNVSVAAWDKTGAEVLPPTPLQNVWTGLEGPANACENTDAKGDPIVLYDEAADRWLITQFAFNDDEGPFYQCLALSETDDPAGSYHVYQFLWDNSLFNDYPKFGVWRDGYYLTVNQFTDATPAGTFVGVGTAVFERDAMLTGGPAVMLKVDLSSDPTIYGALPSDLDGPVLPPAGAPNYIAMWDDDVFEYSPDQLRIFEMHTDWDAGEARVELGGVLDLGAAGLGFDFDVCNNGGADPFCIPQGGSPHDLDALNDRMMWRLAYRNFGTHEALVTNHTVDAGGGRAGVRWYEIRDPANPFVRQGGTFAPGSDDRWMGSAAIDADGNIAIGYSASSSGEDPGIRYAARTAADAPGTMRGEVELQDGTGSQESTAGRWGDYSTMSVDPADDCTFWYTNQYYSDNSQQAWQTRIGSFSFDPECDGLELGKIAGTVTSGGGAPIGGATVQAGTLSAVTAADGTYEIDHAPFGTYTVTASAPRRVPRSTAVTVNGTETADFALTSLNQRHADFDGDGFGDLAIGVPNDVREGKAAGAVNVLYGSASGLTGAGDEELAQDTPGIEESPQAGDAFGYSLATGDFDGDGFTDLAVGAPFESFNGRSEAGKVHVVYGGANGLRTSNDQQWHQNRSGIQNVAEAGDNFGFALAAGDFDRNGRDDLAVGVPGENNGRGAINVLYGTPDGLRARGDRFFMQNSRGIANAAEANDNFGYSLAAGDFGETKRDDLAIGVRLEDHSGETNAGAVNVLYGKGDGGLHRDGNQFWHQDRAGIADAAEAGDQFGHDLTAADFDGNGRDDLAVGVWQENHSGKPNPGAVNVLFGRAGGLSSDGDEFWHRGRSGVAGAPGANDNFGFELTAGDFDRNGRADLAVGSPGDNLSDGRTDAGAANVLYGTAGGLTATGDDLWSQDDAGTGVRAEADAFRFGLPLGGNDPGEILGSILVAAEADDLASFGLAAGDFDGDGFADLASGAPGETLMNSSLTGVRILAGSATVLRGGPRDLTSAGSTTWAQDSNSVLGRARAVELFGYVLAG